MAEINIKINALTNSIAELNSLKLCCEGSKISPPITSGGGKAVMELEEIGNLYYKMNVHLSILLASTIVLLQKTREGFEADDKKAAIKISKR